MFFIPQSIALKQLALTCKAELVNVSNDSEITISGAAPIEAALSGNITFIDNPKYLKYLPSTKASAIFCHEKYVGDLPDHLAALVHKEPYKAYALALAQIYPTALRPLPITGEQGISKHAFLSDDVFLEEDVIIEAGAIIGTNVKIGKGSAILAGAVIGSNVTIGRNTTVSSNASVIHAMIGDNVIIHNGVQIGQDGFGFAMSGTGHQKVPQIGRVIIQDRVEIGANTTIDRGANRDTMIGEGTKIDNLVQIGHNVTIGCNCIIVGHVGISGSATLGDFVVVAGQAGIVGHTKVGDRAQIGGGSGVHGDVDPGAKVMGTPAISASRWMRKAAKEVLEDKRHAKKKG